MNNQIWARTLLYAYNCFENIVREIDRNVLSCAIGTSKMIGEEGTFRAFSQINKLIDRKVLLINLKVFVDELLSKLKPVSKTILTHKYINGFCSASSSKMLGISQRTYFRKYKEAINEFTYYLKISNNPINSFNSITTKETWLKEIYSKILDKELNRKVKKCSTKSIDTEKNQPLNVFEYSRVFIG